MKLKLRDLYNDALIVFMTLAAMMFATVLGSIVSDNTIKDVAFSILITVLALSAIVLIIARAYYSKYSHIITTKRKSTNLYDNIDDAELTLSEMDAIKFAYNNKLYPIKLSSVDLDSEIDFKDNGEFIINRMTADEKSHFYTFNIDGNVNLRSENYRDLVAIVYSEDTELELEYNDKGDQIDMNVMNFNDTSVPDVLYEAQDRLLRVKRIYTNTEGELTEVWNNGDKNNLGSSYLKNVKILSEEDDK